MAKRKLGSLDCFYCKKGKKSAGRCMNCGRTYCLLCFGRHNYFRCDVKPARGYPKVLYTCAQAA